MRHSSTVRNDYFFLAFFELKRFDFTFLLQDDDDANSGIHFVATGGSYKRSNSQLRGRPISSHSSNDHHHHLNNQSVASSLNRVGSVTSILKNLFKRTGGTSAQSAGDGECLFISSQIGHNTMFYFIPSEEMIWVARAPPGLTEIMCHKQSIAVII